MADDDIDRELDEIAAAAHRRVARMDQLGAALAANAQPFGEYFHALRESGFDRDEAFQMTLAAQDSWFGAIFMDADPGPV